MSYAHELGTRGLDLAGEPLPVWPSAPSQPIGVSPQRRPNSVRRTMTLEATWPNSKAEPTVITGRCRDVWTSDPVRPPKVLADDALRAVAEDRKILSLSATPARSGLSALEGARPGCKFRSILNEAMPDERDTGTPLYLMLDDLAGTTLVSPWARSRWYPDWTIAATEEGRKAHADAMLGNCLGLRPGSSGIIDQGAPVLKQNSCDVAPIRNPSDPEGWHPFTDLTDKVQFRRARRIDVWLDGSTIHVETHFQDSTNTREGATRRALHEYLLWAQADAQTTLLTAINARAGTLPYGECPGAIANLRFLVGTPLSDLRSTVLQLLRRTNGCTHLNDVVRSLAEVPAMLSRAPKDVILP